MLTDKALLKIAAGFRNGIVGTGPSQAKCAMVCYPLAGYLSCLGLDVAEKETTVGQWNHIWLQLPDGRVLDPTADQFLPDAPHVYLGPKLAIHLEEKDSRQGSRVACW